MVRSAESRHRTVRFGRRRGRDEVDGETVVRAVVHARLLGLRLLTLDARVIVSPPGVPHRAPVSPDAVLLAPAEPVDRSPVPTSQARSTAQSRAPRLADAVQLLAQGADTLQEVRQLRGSRPVRVAVR